MTKIKVDEIETLSTNQNVEIKTGDNGTLEIQGDTNDGTLQLNCSAQSHGVKIKAPTSSAGQNYTMVLPDNQIAASKYLKVKSVTGDVGQLEYADQPVADLSNLSASNLTSGTIPSARFSLPATSGAGLKFVSETVVGSTAVSQIDITLEQNTLYKLIVKNMEFSVDAWPRMLWFNGGTGGNGNGGAIGYQYWNRWIAYSSGEYAETLSSSNWNAVTTDLNATRWSSPHTHYAATALISTGSGVENGTSYSYGGPAWMRWMAHHPGTSKDTMCELWSWTTSVNGQWLGSIRFTPSPSYATFQQNTRILLYKFQEA
tara:strand:- start:210 stop:1154 length:945 start_codon:yes stop_codon:yes gene_type:complete